MIVIFLNENVTCHKLFNKRKYEPQKGEAAPAK